MPELTKESFEDQKGRLEAMAYDHGTTWDLSENDQAAIKAVLAALNEARTSLALVTTERDQLQALLRTNGAALATKINEKLDLEDKLAAVTTERDHALKELAKQDAGNMQGGSVGCRRVGTR